MLDKKYNKALTVILIIVVIAIFVILGFWGYDVYRKYYINNGANEALQEFDNRIASRNNTATNNTSNDIVESNVSLNIDVNDVETTTNTISSDGKIAKQTYKGYTVVGKIDTIYKIKLSSIKCCLKAINGSICWSNVWTRIKSSWKYCYCRS